MHALNDPLTRLKYFVFFMYGSWSLLNPFLPLYFQEVGFDNMQIGLLMSVGPLISLLANPFWGYWSDRLQNTRLILLIMLIGNMITSQLYFLSSFFWLVFFLMMIFYFFQTALNPLSNSLTLQTIENTPLQFGTFRLWGSVGFAVMVLAASPFISIIGIEHLGYLYGGFVLITLLIGISLPKPQKKRKNKQKTFGQISELLRSKLFVSFLILSILLSIPNRINSNFIGVFISEIGGTEIHVGWSWFLAAILEIPLFLLLDRYLKVTGRAMFGLMTIVSALYIARWLLMAVADSPLQVMFIQLLHGFTFGVMYYTGTQICNMLVPHSIRSSGMAIYGLCWMGIAGIVSGLLGGWLLEMVGSAWMYLICMIMSAVGTLGFFMIWHYFRKQNVTSEASASA